MPYSNFKASGAPCSSGAPKRSFKNAFKTMNKCLDSGGCTFQENNKRALGPCKEKLQIVKDIEVVLN
jgi:hypothetical protein